MSHYLPVEEMEQELQAALQEFRTATQEIEEETQVLEQDLIQALEREKMSSIKKKLDIV